MKIPMPPLTEMVSRAKQTELLKEAGFRVSPSTLARAASDGSGPPYWRWQNQSLYYPPLTLKWAADRLRYAGAGTDPFVGRGGDAVTQIAV